MLVILWTQANSKKRRVLLQSSGSSLRVVLAFNQVTEQNYYSNLEANSKSGHDAEARLQQSLRAMMKLLYPNSNPFGLPDLSVSNFRVMEKFTTARGRDLITD